jgi:hypothetical protein
MPKPDEQLGWSKLLLSYDASAPQQMHQEHHDAYDEQDVNEPGGNVKREETKQPKNNQNRSDESKHVFISFSVCGKQKCLLPHTPHGRPFLGGFVLLGIKAARLETTNLFDLRHILKSPLGLPSLAGDRPSRKSGEVLASASAGLAGSPITHCTVCTCE